MTLTIRDRSRGAVVVLGAALLLSGCGANRAHPTIEELRTVPGATLTFPGAVGYRRIVTDSAAGMDGGTPAAITIDACASMEASAVASWFDRHLTGAGWTRDPATHSVDRGLYIKGYTWIRGARRFDLLFETRTNADRLATEAGRTAGCLSAYRTLAQ